ncbi:hypothetical protein [Streptomyces sp. NBC_00239]|uniref:hypothetical protein n=1 Tax=Streptomyces sp. NBC_00239 TaxID=2903640 RepID=UPI002E2A4FA5|nr:hypothetical protein [Streptomyces sp. NBC_00239]
MRTALAVSVATAAAALGPVALTAPAAAAPAVTASSATRPAAPAHSTSATLSAAAHSASAALSVPALSLADLSAPAHSAPTPLAVAAPAAAVPQLPPHDVGEGGGAKPAPARPARVRGECGDGKSAEFPLGARIRGGPAVYRSGGGPQTWYLDLTNPGRADCRAVHPVVVFADRAHALKASQLHLEFTDRGTAYPVTLEQSDQDEVIAVFDGAGAFPGFTVAANGSVTVAVRLSFAADTPPGEVVADAALVQRKGDDGDWVGETGGYRFAVAGPEEPAEPGAAGSLADTGRSERLCGLGAAAGAVAAAGAAMRLGARRLRRP